MAQLNKTCVACGEEYSYCNVCDSHNKEPLWKSTFDNENCLKVFQIVSDFAQKAISKEVARQKLMSCDLTNKYKFKLSIRETINEINKPDFEYKKPEVQPTPLEPQTKSSDLVVEEKSELEVEDKTKSEEVVTDKDTEVGNENTKRDDNKFVYHRKRR